jgi:heme exporter protein D
MMHWASLNDFFAMGGYGFYVWLSFGLTFGCMLLELWQLHARRQPLNDGEGA